MSIVVFDNELYGETGAQKTHISKGVKIKIHWIGEYLIYNLSELKVFSDNINKITNLILQIKIFKDNGEMISLMEKNRFRNVLLGRVLI